ncbi:hypothetical protein PAXRUDRAFT_165610 [Paxillus rubicundulus Ve08.2h10]|uniref:Uncharacterized protein n=1 Tax=Paxillus rubicundulus Ve08.2h10 TaxID=930991 RepID=A0A0D0CR36_9AGAM|nr:hypothetical protein PAXRUDRAFT_165610 [Paxillus rubicundulus Ve08.2h10]
MTPPLHSHLTFSPDRNDLKEALKSGGMMDLDVKQGILGQKFEQVDFHPIPTHNLDKLVAENGAFDIKKAELHCGSIRLDLSTEAIFGMGAYKTAQAACLMISPLRPSGLGSGPNHAIALK